MNKKTETKVDTLIAELWERHLPTLIERLDLLDRTAAEASSGSLAEAMCAEALSIAHKLAGNLGMFGYPKGSEVASEIEQTLRTPTPKPYAHLTKLTRQLRQAVEPL